MANELPEVKWSLSRCHNENYPLDFFFDPATEDEAVAVCQLCPIRTDCLAWALSKPEYYGVWGGMSEAGRRKSKTKRQRVKCPGCESTDVYRPQTRNEICKSCGLSWRI